MSLRKIFKPAANYELIRLGKSFDGGYLIGKNSIIGAGSLVLSDIPDNVIAFGNPCKVVRDNQ